MKVIAPAYYRDFTCIASACSHSCCVGWEVDVDSEALAFYESMDSSLGARIRESIDLTDIPHFRLDSDEKCPHLSPSGLCSIISECGESALCQICRDHPRYRNLYDGVIELGLGLCCEEAVRIAISNSTPKGFLVSESEDMSSAVYSPMYPIELFSEDERPLAEEKQRLISIATDGGRSIVERLSALLPIPIDFNEIKALYLSLETLDDKWRDRIDSLSAEDFYRDFKNISDCVERMLVTFLFRHITTESFYEPSTAAAFAALSAHVIAATAPLAEDIPDACRAYSAEIEYSTENTEKILDYIEERMHI